MGASLEEEIKKRRTFAIISHPDAGKTTLTEKFLLYGGAINTAGSVKGKANSKYAVSDWMEIEIIDNTEKSEQQELAEDLVQIITVFSCKLQGKRANKAKKLIRELIQEETDGKSHKSNADTKQRTEN